MKFKDLPNWQQEPWPMSPTKRPSKIKMMTKIPKRRRIKRKDELFLSSILSRNFIVFIYVSDKHPFFFRAIKNMCLRKSRE
jgi:hypothetical protein